MGHNDTTILEILGHNKINNQNNMLDTITLVYKHSLTLSSTTVNKPLHHQQYT